MMNQTLYLEDLRRALDASPPIDALRGKRVMVTGASGLIGSFVVDMLMLANVERGASIDVFAVARNLERLYRRFERHLGNERFHLLAQDVTDGLNPDAEMDFIIHAASPAHPMAFSTDPVGTMRANLLGTMALLEFLHAQKHGRLLFVSSGEVYGERRGEDELDFSEDSLGYIDCAAARSCYPEGKRAAETLCASYKRQYGVDVAIARPSHVYGATITDENNRADAQFLRKALAREDIVMKSAGSQIRSYLYVADAASGLMWVMLKGKAGEAYNIANPHSMLSIRQYAETLAECAGVKVVFEMPTEIEKAGYSTITRATLDAGKLMGIGWTPQFEPGEGIKRMLSIHCHS